MLLSEFTQGRAVIEPDMLISPVEDFPEVTVSVFSWQLFESVLELLDARVIARVHSVDGLNPVYRVEYGGRSFAFYKSMMGGPKCVADYEDIMAMGSKRLILFGNCGVLDRSIEDCGIIIPTAALRDEGVSYHYLPPSDAVELDGRYRELFREVLRERGVSWVEGVTWTTDGVYRETPERVGKRRAQGAITVEMECASMQALCSYRGTEFFQFLYAGDNLDGTEWEPRSVSGGSRLDDKVKIAFLAFELGLKIYEALEI